MNHAESEKKTWVETLGQQLFEDRIVFLAGMVDQESTLAAKLKLLYLESKDSKRDIFLFIDSYGGSVAHGLSLYDTMNFISCDVWTICFGVAMSMGAFLLSGGTKGKRVCFPNSAVMIHQPLMGLSGDRMMQSTEWQIQAKSIAASRERLNRIMARHTGQTFERIDQDTERDNYMTAEEALNYGIVDVIATNRDDLAKLAASTASKGDRR